MVFLYRWSFCRGGLMTPFRVQQCVVVDVAVDVDVWRGSRLDKKRMQLNLNIPN